MKIDKVNYSEDSVGSELCINTRTFEVLEKYSFSSESMYECMYEMNLYLSKMFKEYEAKNNAKIIGVVIESRSYNRFTETQHVITPKFSSFSNFLYGLFIKSMSNNSKSFLLYLNSDNHLIFRTNNGVSISESRILLMTEGKNNRHKLLSESSDGEIYLNNEIDYKNKLYVLKKI